MNQETVTVNREYKSTVFSLLYQDKEKLLSLYNALNPKRGLQELTGIYAFCGTDPCGLFVSQSSGGNRHEYI